MHDGDRISRVCGEVLVQMQEPLTILKTEVTSSKTVNGSRSDYSWMRHQNPPSATFNQHMSWTVQWFIRIPNLELNQMIFLDHLENLLHISHNL